MKVLLPIDGSIYSDRAIEYICEHSSLRAKTDTVYLLNVQKKLPSEGYFVNFDFSFVLWPPYDGQLLAYEAALFSAIVRRQAAPVAIALSLKSKLTK